MKNPIEKPPGIFSASIAGSLCAGGSGKTRQSTIYNCVLKELDLYRDFDNMYMKHGRANERTAYDFISKRFSGLGKFRLCSDEFIPYNDTFGASPDILINEKIPADIKCPTLNTFLALLNNFRLPKDYFYQLQSQMLATGAENAFIFYFLTRPEVWGEDNWEDYDFTDDSQRIIVYEVKRDEEIISTILDAVEKATAERVIIKYLIENALRNKLTFSDLINVSKKNRVKPLKEANLLRITKEDVFSFEQELFHKY